MDRPVPQISLKERRERTVEVLCQHFAQDRLEVSEFEARLDLAHRARDLAELDAILADLPAPAAPPAPHGAARPQTARGETRTHIAFMGGIDRRGHWMPARRNVVIAVMGGAALDFREVQLPPGETEIFLVCFMGGAEIIVPPDLAVDSSGIAIMGGFESVSPPRGTAGDAPVLRINGFCVMGGVEVQVRRPGESAREARERSRHERRQLREQRRLQDGE